MLNSPLSLVGICLVLMQNTNKMGLLESNKYCVFLLSKLSIVPIYQLFLKRYSSPYSDIFLMALDYNTSSN